MSRTTSLAVLLLALCGHFQLGAAQLPFNAPGYRAVAIPQECIPAHVGARIKDVAQFLSFSERETFQARGNSVSLFIELFGLPDEYRTKTRRKADEWDYLVYRLAGGEIIYVHATGAPHCRFGAAAAIDKKGKLLRLVK
jgi:hypothetical protein